MEDSRSVPVAFDGVALKVFNRIDTGELSKNDESLVLASKQERGKSIRTILSNCDF